MPQQYLRDFGRSGRHTGDDDENPAGGPAGAVDVLLDHVGQQAQRAGALDCLRQFTLLLGGDRRDA
jgi:hypothetical protein